MADRRGEGGEAAAGPRAMGLEEAAARFVPPRLVELLGAGDLRDLKLGDAAERKMTVLFSDIRDFTALAEAMSPAETFRFINSFLAAVEPAVTAHGGFVDKYIGDAVMALFPGGADDAVAAGVGMLDALERFNASRGRDDRPRIRIGVGLNTGVVMLGVVGGGSRLEGTVVSDAVNLASRLEGLTRTYGAPILVGEQTLYALSDAARRPVRYLDRIRVKGKRHPQSIHELFAADPPALREAKAGTVRAFEQGVAWYHLKRIDDAERLFAACVDAAPDDAPARLYLERCRAYRREGRHEGTGELDGSLAWRPEFELGVRLQDEQHRELLRQINAVGLGLRCGGGGALAPALEFLGRYAVEHFAMEEGLMAEHGYPFADAHRLEHRNFVAYFERLRSEVVAGETDPLLLLFRVQVFLFDWFATHSTGTDRHLARWLRFRGLGEAAPAPA